MEIRVGICSRDAIREGHAVVDAGPGLAPGKGPRGMGAGVEEFSGWAVRVTGCGLAKVGQESSRGDAESRRD